VRNTITLPLAGYGPQALAFNAAVREQGHGVTVQGREWLSFGRKWIRFRVDGVERRITWPQFGAGAWS
jgi:hypothetical protein